MPEEAIKRAEGSQEQCWESVGRALRSCRNGPPARESLEGEKEETQTEAVNPTSGEWVFGNFKTSTWSPHPRWTSKLASKRTAARGGDSGSEAEARGAQDEANCSRGGLTGGGGEAELNCRMNRGKGAIVKQVLAGRAMDRKGYITRFSIVLKIGSESEVMRDDDSQPGREAKVVQNVRRESAGGAPRRKPGAQAAVAVLLRGVPE